MKGIIPEILEFEVERGEIVKFEDYTACVLDRKKKTQGKKTEYKFVMGTQREKVIKRYKLRQSPVL